MLNVGTQPVPVAQAANMTDRFRDIAGAGFTARLTTKIDPTHLGTSEKYQVIFALYRSDSLPIAV